MERHDLNFMDQYFIRLKYYDTINHCLHDLDGYMNTFLKMK